MIKINYFAPQWTILRIMTEEGLSRYGCFEVFLMMLK